MREDLTPKCVAAPFKSDRAVASARHLGKRMTPAEKALWFELRQFKLQGSQFRRQGVIGPFVVDFASHGAMLVIELGGGVHRAEDIALCDDERSAWIVGQGYKIMRFSNAQVMADAAAVGDEILVQARARMRVIAMMREHDPFERRAG